MGFFPPETVDHPQPCGSFFHPSCSFRSCSTARTFPTAPTTPSRPRWNPCTNTASRYLAKNQTPQGNWTDNVGSEPAVVGLCVLAFLAHGEDANVGPNAPYIRKGIDYILSQQNANNGYIGNSMYNHGFSTLALAEAYGMVDNPKIAPALKKAVDLILSAQKRNPKSAWRYTPDAKDSDTTVSGCQIVALFAARNAGIGVPDDAMTKGLAYMAGNRESDGSYGYTSKGGGKPTLTAIGSLCLSLAKDKDSKGYQASLAFLKKNLDFRDRYYPYYYEYLHVPGPVPRRRGHVARLERPQHQIPLHHSKSRRVLAGQPGSLLHHRRGPAVPRSELPLPPDLRKMKLLLPAVLLGLLPAYGADEAVPPPVNVDLLRFSNGNRLDGHFAGLKKGANVIWKRDDVEAPVEFKSSQLRQVVLRGGRPAKQLPDLSTVTLINGDRIPGTVTAISARDITLDTPFSGPLVLPRNAVTSLSPNPLGGKLLYNGPFSEEGWTTRATGNPDNDAPQPRAADKDKETAEAKVPAWSYSSGAWYHRQGNAALVRDVGMTDQSVLRFQVAWKTRLSMSVAFHADLKDAPQAPANGANAANGQRAVRIDSGSGSLPQMFGNAYVMNLYTGYVILNRCGYDNNGKPYTERLQSNVSNTRLPESGEATVEIRCSRQTGEITLFVNEEFAAQWNENVAPGESGYAGKGGAIGFQVQGMSMQGQSGTAVPVRISDILVAEWNGMPDAARSMQSNDQDIVLLTNGTDRFSGEVTGLENGKLQLKGRYGNFELPLSQISETRFARNHLAKPAEPAADRVSVRFLPFGQISGTIADGNDAKLSLDSPLAGKVQMDIDYAVMLDFKNSTSFLDDWDPQY